MIKNDIIIETTNITNKNISLPCPWTSDPQSYNLFPHVVDGHKFFIF